MLPTSGKILWEKKTRAVLKVPTLVTAYLEDRRPSCNKEINRDNKAALNKHANSLALERHTVNRTGEGINRWEVQLMLLF